MTTKPRYCEQCGAPLPQGAAFCEQCGRRIDDPIPPPAPQTSAEPRSIPKPRTAPGPADERPADPRPPRRAVAWWGWGLLLALSALAIGTLVLVGQRSWEIGAPAESAPSTEGLYPDVPAPAPASDLDGIWFAEPAGTGVAVARVEFQQEGDQFQGQAVMLDGSNAATVSGVIEGPVARWTWTDRFGNTGSGVGTLRPDGDHMDATITSAGLVETQVLHRGHLPQ